MTREEAIRILDPETSRDALLKYADLPVSELMEVMDEATGIAVTALRAQQVPAKLDRRRWDGCEWCRDIVPHLRNSTMMFCIDCGRPLTEEAWAELERRIGGDDETADLLEPRV